MFKGSNEVIELSGLRSVIYLNPEGRVLFGPTRHFRFLYVIRLGTARDDSACLLFVDQGFCALRTDINS